MRLALIIGGAEPGHDGIGDHAALLAGELIDRGHEAWLLALSDPHVDGLQSQALIWHQREIPTVRIPRLLPARERYALARAALNQRDTKAVLYDLTTTHHEPRGLVWSLAPDMASLATGRRSAVLVHEYALGSEQGAGLKRQLWGRLQRAGFRRFVRKLDRPHLAATNLLYAKMMQRDGLAAEVVDLYGNVSLHPAPQDNWCHAQLRAAGIAPHGQRGYYVAGFFGTIYDGADLAAAIPALHDAARAADGRLAILSVGHLGAGENLWLQWQSQFGPGTAADIPFLALGRRDTNEVADYIHGLDLGLSTVSMSLAGKSGTLAAFTDFGLRALMINDSVHYSYMPDNTICLPQGALAPGPATTALLTNQPHLPRVFRPMPTLQTTADWVERVLG
ncbi:MAG: hypothetical protein ABI439_01405 [Rhodospirillales bacterium]